MINRMAIATPWLVLACIAALGQSSFQRPTPGQGSRRCSQGPRPAAAQVERDTERLRAAGRNRQSLVEYRTGSDIVERIEVYFNRFVMITEDSNSWAGSTPNE